MRPSEARLATWDEFDLDKGVWTIPAERNNVDKKGKTGISMEIPEGFAGLIYARSGLASKKGLAPANKVGVVDADYRGEIMVALHNHSNDTVSIEPKERIAQLVITPFLKAVYNEVAELNETVRGEGGFGSTGKL